MSKSRAEVIIQTLNNLGVIATGQVPSDSDVSRLDLVVDGAFATLVSLDVYYVSDPGDFGPSGGVIEDDAFLPLCDYIAARASSAFNLPADTKLVALGEVAKSELITMSAPQRSRRTLRVDAALSSRRLSYRGGF